MRESDQTPEDETVSFRPGLLMRISLIHANRDGRRNARLHRHKRLCKTAETPGEYRFVPKDTRIFRQQASRMKNSGADMELLEKAIAVLAEGNPMPDSFEDRPYIDSENPNRSCRVGSGWRLYYAKIDGNLELRAVRHTGYR